jgi:DNA sulfur modification protein DndE
MCLMGTSGMEGEMQLNRIKVSEDVDQKLKQLKAKTGLTPNLLCRIGFCLSLREPGIPDPYAYDENSNREFNRYTLTGAWDSMFVAVLIQRCAKNDIFIPENIEEQFRAHINRGVLLLFQRVKHLNDICRLIEETNVDSVPFTDVEEAPPI